MSEHLKSEVRLVLTRFSEDIDFVEGTAKHYLYFSRPDGTGFRIPVPSYTTESLLKEVFPKTRPAADSYVEAGEVEEFDGEETGEAIVPDDDGFYQEPEAMPPPGFLEEMATHPVPVPITVRRQVRTEEEIPQL